MNKIGYLTLLFSIFAFSTNSNAAKIVEGSSDDAQPNMPVNQATEENQQDSSLENRFAAWVLEQTKPQIDTLAELRNQFEEDLQNGAYDMARRTAKAVLGNHKYTTLQKDEARSWLQKLEEIESQINASIESQINVLAPIYDRFKNCLEINDFVMARAVVNFVKNDNKCTELQKKEVDSWLLEVNEAEAQINPLIGIRREFEKNLQNKEYDMARMTVNSVLGSRRYTTLQKDEARSWLQEVDQAELPQADTLDEIYTDFKNCIQARDFDMANVIVQSIIYDDEQYTEQQKAKVRSWLGEIPRS